MQSSAAGASRLLRPPQRSQVLQGSFALILAALIYFHTVKIWHIFILSFLTGSAQSLSGPAYASLLPLLVKRDDMSNAVAMNSMQFNLARVIGPALGGVVFGLWGILVLAPWPGPGHPSHGR